MKKDLLSIVDLNREEVDELLEKARRMKRKGPTQVLAGKTLALLF